MKRIALLLILGITLNANAGGFLFPNVEFEYAKLYLFNLNLDKPSHMDFRIYKDGIYAKSKLGNGQILSDKFHEKVQKTFARGIDELNMGLSKCYMPRHGIIYYSKEHVPVASLSICFECDKISVWSIEGYSFKDDYEKFNLDKAEKQISDLAKIVTEEGIPVYSHPDDLDKYLLHLKKEAAFNAERTIKITVDQELNAFTDTITSSIASNWIHKTSKLSPKETIDTLQNSDGTLDIFQVVKMGNKTIFNFIDNQLIEGRIYHNAIILPLEISVGMSIAEVYQKLGYTKPKEGFPSNIVLSGTDWMLQLNFKYQSLNEIVIKGR